MLKPITLSIAAVFMVMFTVAAPAHAQKLLRWKFVAGQSLRAQLTQRMETETSFSNKPVKLLVDVTMDMTWRVDSTEESGAALVTQSFDKILLKMAVPPAEAVEFDSSNQKQPTGDAKEIAALVAPLVGAKFTVKFSSRGDILDVTIPNETATALSLASANGGQAFFTKERINQLLRQSAAVLPEKEIKTGDKWDESTIIDSPLGKLKQKSTYTYQGEEDREGLSLDKIRLESQLEIPTAKSGSGSSSLKEQTLTGTIYFNNVAGRAVESKVSQTMKTETRVRENLISATANTTLKTVLTAQ